MVVPGRVIGRVVQQIEFGYVLIEAEGAREESDHGDWDAGIDVSHTIAGAVAIAVRVPIEGEVDLRVLRTAWKEDLLPLLVFAGRLESAGGGFVLSGPLETFRIEFASSGSFEVWVDDHPATQVQVVVGELGTCG